ncbi:YraN family protein [Entomobacter blattae]|uniref:UPF0102 protein JGUZn3_15160 n=1 Tax=Entomobacter blattae TaxID=2762277 RepID=A0A7H1NSH9_9PROT|nr:YraN family protein [Entomobacter blattae]QNT78739.1 hypothetical protein JGUZn3_15160 [Entomobacter blattae]
MKLQTVTFRSYSTYQTLRLPSSFFRFTMNKIRRPQKGALHFAIGYNVELAALRYLTTSGWQILSHRYKTAYGEIDIIAQHNEILVFFEVKHRKTLQDAAYSLSRRQQVRILNAASYILAEHTHWHYKEVRIDALLHNSQNQWEHLTNIVSIE